MAEATTVSHSFDAGTANVVKPGMIVYCFAPAARGAATYLAWCWHTCLELGMRDPIAGFLPPPLDPADYFGQEVLRSLGEVEPVARVLFAATRPGVASADVAFAFRIADAFGLAAQLAPNNENDSLHRWPRLRDEWVEARATASVAVEPAPVGAMLGEAMLFTALWPDDGLVQRTLAAEIEAALGLSRIPSADLIEPEILLWESPRDPADPRLLAAIAPHKRETDLDRFFWWDTTQRAGLSPFLRYLLNAAKLRYEVTVFQSGIPEHRQAKQNVDASVDRLIDAQAKLPKRGTARIDPILEAQVEVETAQTGAAGLLRAITRLRELRQTGRVAAQNMSAALAGRMHVEREDRAGPIVRDAALGSWLEDQVEHELTYLQAARDRADGARALVMLRLQHTADARARLQNQLTLFQASLVGGLLAVIGVIQVPDPDLPVGSRLDMPVAAFVGALVFALPLLVVDWFEPFELLEYAAGAVLGAAAGWLAVRWAFPGASFEWQLVASGAALMAAVVVLALISASWSSKPVSDAGA